MSIHRLIALGVTLLLGLGLGVGLASCHKEPIDFDSPTLRCNGLVELCDLPLNEVVFARTHNAHASEDAGYDLVNWNHFNGVPTQLADGIRSLNFDIYHYEGETVLCHGACVFATQPAVDALIEVADFLDANRFEVVLLDLQNETTLEHTVAAFEQSGITAWAHTQIPGEPWPTLREMIRLDQRFVVFSNREDGAPAWLHAKGDFIYGTTYHYEAPEELDCILTSAPIPHGILDVTHILTNPLANPENAEAINYNPLLRDRIDTCIAEWGRLPTLIGVDFYSIGDILTVVEDLNLGR